MPLLRLVKTEDLASLAKIFAEAFTLINPEKPWNKEHALHYLEYLYKRQPDLFFVAENEGKLVGAIATGIKPWRTGLRCADNIIFVDATSQQQGVGKALLKKLLETALEKYKVESIESITFADNEFPLSWYKRVGMKPDTHAIFLKGNIQAILKNLE